MVSVPGWFRHGALAAAVSAAVLAVPNARALAADRDAGIVVRYADALASANARLTATNRIEIAQRLLLLASYYRLDPRLLVALVTAESSWRARAVSPVGAMGFGQLMPRTAATLEVDPLEPYENLDGTARYLRRLLTRFAARDDQTRVRLALASYNAGPAAVARYGGIPPYAETRRYVETVVRLWRRYIALIDRPSSPDVERLVARRARVPSVATPPAIAEVPLTRSHIAMAPPHHVTAAFVPYHSPYLDAPDPNGYETPPPAAPRAEASRSLFARIFHRRRREPPPEPSSAAH